MEIGDTLECHQQYASMVPGCVRDPLPRFLDWLYERLTRRDCPAPADLIFVLAGKMERKQYGLELYEAGLAKRLLLSVGRFEVSKMRSWNLPFVPGLIAARDAVRPDQRHFFCELTGDETRITRPNLLRWNTYGEVRGLREHLGKRLPNSIIVISTDIHLRRIAVTFQKVFAGSGVRLQYCPVPPAQSSLRKERWWTRRQDRKYVLSETVKLIGYQVASGFTRGAR